MTPQKLKDLIASGESLAVEFKGEVKVSLSDRELVEAVVCLANRPGYVPAWILVGVEDDGALTGARPRREGGLTDPHRVQAGGSGTAGGPAGRLLCPCVQKYGHVQN